jgi:CRP-like cAMP-binding protein
MEELLTLTHGLPTRTVEQDEVILVDGEPVAELLVLLDGALRVEKAGVTIAAVTEPGACVGEMSLLLEVPATANVVAAQPSVLAVVDDARSLLAGDARFAHALARLLALRLQAMTTYLVDLKQQYGDHEGGLGMVDVVLGTLMRGSGRVVTLRSERDPDPEY